MEVSSSYQDQEYRFTGKWDAPSICGLKVVKLPDRHIVIATELYDRNPGSSVTSVNALLAAQVCRDFGLDANKLLFIERTPDRGSKLEIYRECFDVVRFDRDGDGFANPQWESIDRDDVDRLLAQGQS